MPLFYADSSALVKLVRDEPESAALRAFVDDAELISCELVLTEVPRAIKRAAARDTRLPVDLLLDRAGETLDAIALLPLDRSLLVDAGAIAGTGAQSSRRNPHGRRDGRVTDRRLPQL